MLQILSVSSHQRGSRPSRVLKLRWSGASMAGGDVAVGSDGLYHLSTHRALSLWEAMR